MANNAKVALTGRLIREPKQSTYNNSTVVSFTVAVNTTKKDGDKYVSDLYNISIWGKSAEFILPRVSKGSLVQVYGDLYMDTYKDKNNVERQSLTVRATEVLPLSNPGAQHSAKSEPTQEDPF